MEQLVDPVRGLPVIDAPVPQVEQLVEVLMSGDVEQVITVPKLAQEDRIPLRAVFREQRVAAAHGHPGARQGRPWHPLAPRGWSAPTTPGGPGQRDSPPAQGGTQILGSLPSLTVDVPVTMLHKFLQFYVVYILILVPQIQFIDRVLDTAVVPQRQVRCELCRRPGRLLSAVLWQG